MLLALFFKIFILDPVCIVDQDGKEQGLGKTGCDHGFQMFYHSCFGAWGALREEATPRLQTAPVSRYREWPPHTNLWSWNSAHPKGSAQVVSRVLKCCWSQWSKNEETHPMPAGRHSWLYILNLSRFMLSVWLVWLFTLFCSSSFAMVAYVLFRPQWAPYALSISGPAVHFSIFCTEDDQFSQKGPRNKARCPRPCWTPPMWLMDWHTPSQTDMTFLTLVSTSRC